MNDKKAITAWLATFLDFSGIVTHIDVEITTEGFHLSAVAIAI